MQDRLGHEFSLSRLTHEYRTKVLQLGSTSNTEVAWLASQAADAIPSVDGMSPATVASPWLGLSIGLLALLSFVNKTDC